MLILLLSMPFSSLATVAETLGKLALEDVELAVRGPSWPWGLSPGLEISEGLELASELVGVDVTGDLASEGVDAEAEYFEVEARENFTFLSPPHLEDPLLDLIFGVSLPSLYLRLPQLSSPQPTRIGLLVPHARVFRPWPCAHCRAARARQRAVPQVQCRRRRCSRHVYPPRADAR